MSAAAISSEGSPWLDILVFGWQAFEGMGSTCTPL